jgi:energy-coupling factor transport system ATP-binding protein
VEVPRRPERRHGAETVCCLRGVSFAYEDSLYVVDGADLELRRGEVVAVEGPNGCGKTTLAKLAAGLLEPSRGRVDRGASATYLLQDPGRYVLTERVGDEVALAADRTAAAEALAALGLRGHEHRHPRDLSSGERERVALAAVLAPNPGLLVLDEPTRGVDPERKAELAQLLRRDAADRATLVVTHDRAFARAVADRVVSPAGAREAVRA